MKSKILGGWVCAMLLLGCPAAPDDEVVDNSESTELGAGIARVRFDAPGRSLIVEVLDDDLVHFELTAKGNGPGVAAPLATSPMVAKTDYPGPSQLTRSGYVVETPEIRVEVSPGSLCVSATDKKKGLELTRICPDRLDQDWKGLTIEPKSMQNVYGLGQEFIVPGSADGDWTGRTRSPGGADGNAMVSFNGGANGNTQIPVMYALGAGNDGYALFLDNVYKQRWDFTQGTWRADMWGDQVRFYLMTGDDLPDLRRDYMELVGRPLVPPKKAFGLWVSEFGFENWAEIDDKLSSLRDKGYPVDGFVLDLYWFGGVTAGSDQSNMGRVAWDESRFPQPGSKIAELRDQHGVGLILIEESYVSRGLSEHGQLEGKGFLAKECDGCGATYLTQNPWWGKGGMIDWTNSAASDFWHDQKRQTLVDQGVLGHWLDLGEPEMYNWWARYAGGSHADVHNIYTLRWIEGIARGYQRHAVTQRPFMMARSGAAGMQRYGASMWSADIASRLSSLATHMNAQMHMSMSGIDYYGADIGGFHRSALDGDRDDMFTQWFANGALLDVPTRVHVDNDSCKNCYQTAPDRVGKPQDNLENLRLRYELVPYLYSLAHRAFRTGEPVFPPPLYRWQDDATLRELGHEKLIGDSLLVAIVAGYGETERGVYLPEGRWVDWHSNDWVQSGGAWLDGFPEYRHGRFKLPLFARAGAIVPKAFVDEQTMNVFGKRKDGSKRDELVVRVFSDITPSTFTLYEDDGETTGYLQGAVRSTVLSQSRSGSTATVTIEAASGSWSGALSSRANVVELVLDDETAAAVTLDGASLGQHESKAAFDAASSGWYRAGRNLVIAKGASVAVSSKKTFTFTLTPSVRTASVHFVCKNGATSPGESVYVVGSDPKLGSWAAAAAIELEPVAYPKWTGVVDGLSPGTKLEWKCIKRWESGGTATAWQPGANSVVTLPASGFAGTTTGSF